MSWRQKGEGFKGQRIVVIPRRVLDANLKHPLLKSLCPTHAGYFPKAKGHLRERKTGTPDTIFIYCAQGRGWCDIACVRHEVNKDRLLIVPPGVPHAYGASEDQPWSIHWFHAVGENVPLYVQSLGATPANPVVPLFADVQLLSLFEDVLEGVEHGLTLPHLIYAAHALSHLMGLLLWHKQQFPHGHADASDRVARTLHFMKAHLREPLKISTLAAMVGVSPALYRAQFRRITGSSPINYFIHLRMQRAVQLLLTTELSVKEIAAQLGYADQFYFTRVFRATHGQSPTEYRQRNQA